MRLSRMRFIGALALSLSLPLTAPGCADTPSPEPAGGGARILDGTSSPLTAPSTRPASVIVTDFLRPTLGSAVDGLILVSESQREGRRHLRFEQRVGDVRIVGAYVKATLDGSGALLHLIEQVEPVEGAVTKASITEATALQATFAHHGYRVASPREVAREGRLTRFSRDASFHRAPTVERVAYVDEVGGLAEGFLVETWTERDNQLDHTLVDGRGGIVWVEDRTADDSYKVFTESPLTGSQVIVNGGNWVSAGTQRSTDISGNNVRAYLDVDANNTPDAGGQPIADGNFLFDVNLSAQPTTDGNRAVAVQNLFYFNNVLHDVLYGVGFDEAHGNFQSDNFGRGGAGNDPVNAEAQDGGGLDNANFATPADGSAPRMQMYLWSSSNPDSQVVSGNTVIDVHSASFGPKPTLTGVSGALALYTDRKAPTTDACQVATGNLNGKIAIIDRGTCDFTAKVGNAQKAGAVGVIVVNNVATAPFSMGGTSTTVTIPSVMVSMADGDVLKGRLGQSVTIRRDPVESLLIDASLDYDIVAHEYGHGLTWRMIGSMSGAMPGAIGEGASDVLAFILTGDPVVAEYSYSNALGIRRAPYDVYTLTYRDFTGAEVHDDGEIYAAAMWNVFEEYLARGLTADQLLYDFVQGMNYTPAGPTFEQMRDGMLSHVGNDPLRRCAIWKGFAAQGIGQGAKYTVNRRGVASITESFTVPVGVCN